MAISYEAHEWKDGASGGTPIDAATLNEMEKGISEAVQGVNELNQAGNVTESDIASGAVTSGKIASGAVGTSALAAGSVTEDKLSDELRDFVSQGIVIVEGSSANVSIPSGSGKGIDVPIEAPEGYEPGWVCSVDTSVWEYSISAFFISGSTVKVYGRNYSSGDISFTCNVKVACLKA